MTFANDVVATNVQKHYGDVVALDSVDMYAPAGQILGLLGPNGAGKTTLVRTLTTLLKPDAGELKVAGIDVLKNPDATREVIGLAGQYPAVDELLTGYENLVMVGQLYHFNRSYAKARAKELLKQFNLEDAAHRTIKTYSGGMRRRLDLAASIVARPQVLFLDEPTTGLDPRTRKDLWGVIRELVDDGTTLVLTTQYLEEADVLADKITLINKGRVIAEGTPADLKSRFANDVLELRVKDTASAQRASELLHSLGKEQPQVEGDTGFISLPVNNGTASLLEAVRTLDGQQIAIEDISLRRPTLDDVFLSLTD